MWMWSESESHRAGTTTSRGRVNRAGVSLCVFKSNATTLVPKGRLLHSAPEQLTSFRTFHIDQDEKYAMFRW